MGLVLFKFPKTGKDLECIAQADAFIATPNPQVPNRTSFTGSPHIMHSLRKRFLKFINNMRNVLNEIKYDCRSVTGRNLRNLSLATSYSDQQVNPYCIPNTETWRVALLNEIMEVKSGYMIIANFTNEEIDSIKEFACCS